MPLEWAVQAASVIVTTYLSRSLIPPELPAPTVAQSYIAAELVNTDPKSVSPYRNILRCVILWVQKHDNKVKNNQPTNNNAEKCEHYLILSKKDQLMLPDHLQPAAKLT